MRVKIFTMPWHYVGRLLSRVQTLAAEARRRPKIENENILPISDTAQLQTGPPRSLNGPPPYVLRVCSGSSGELRLSFSQACCLDSATSFDPSNSFSPQLAKRAHWHIELSDEV